MKAKRIWGKLAVLLGPFAVVLCFYLYMLEAPDVRTPVCALHVFTLVWTGYYLRARPMRLSALPASLLASLLGPWLCDALRPEKFQYIGTMFVMVFYTLPWTALTLVFAVASLLRQKLKGKRGIQYGI